MEYRLALAIMVFCGVLHAGAAAGDWKPAKAVEWVVLSSPGDGSDIYTRTIVSIINQHKLVDQPITVVNQPDGGGVVGQVRVSGVRDGGHTVMTYNRGEIEGLITNTDLRVGDITPLAIMAFDKMLLCTTPQ